MLPDHMKLPVPSAAVITDIIGLLDDQVWAVSDALGVRSLTENGSVRVGRPIISGGEDVGRVTISHSETKENAPYGTTRHLLRMDLKRSDPATGKPMVLSAYSVFSIPGGAAFSQDDKVDLIRTLCCTILFGSLGAADKITPSAGSDPNLLAKILLGES